MTEVVATNAPLFTTSQCGGVVFKIDPVPGVIAKIDQPTAFSALLDEMRFRSLDTNPPRYKSPLQDCDALSAGYMVASTAFA